MKYAVSRFTKIDWNGKYDTDSLVVDYFQTAKMEMYEVGWADKMKNGEYEGAFMQVNCDGIKLYAEADWDDVEDETEMYEKLKAEILSQAEAEDVNIRRLEFDQDYAWWRHLHINLGPDWASVSSIWCPYCGNVANFDIENGEVEFIGNEDDWEQEEIEELSKMVKAEFEKLNEKPST